MVAAAVKVSANLPHQRCPISDGGNCICAKMSIASSRSKNQVGTTLRTVQISAHVPALNLKSLCLASVHVGRTFRSHTNLYLDFLPCPRSHR